MKTVKSLLIAGALTFPVIAITAPEAKADLMVCNNSTPKLMQQKLGTPKKAGLQADGRMCFLTNVRLFSLVICTTILHMSMQQTMNGNLGNFYKKNTEPLDFALHSHLSL